MSIINPSDFVFCFFLTNGGTSQYHRIDSSQWGCPLVLLFHASDFSVVCGKQKARWTVLLGPLETFPLLFEENHLWWKPLENNIMHTYTSPFLFPCQYSGSRLFSYSSMASNWSSSEGIYRVCHSMLYFLFLYCWKSFNQKQVSLVRRILQGARGMAQTLKVEIVDFKMDSEENRKDGLEHKGYLWACLLSESL